MRRFRKYKRVSWASDDNLCQVKLFLKEEAPIQVGLDSQDNLQPQNSRSSHTTAQCSDENLPPGFNAPQQPNEMQIKLSEIPLIEWRPPLKVLLNPKWRVATGEESSEPNHQIQREMKVFEAIYPRQSSIPQNPLYIITDQEDLAETPTIPITSTEDGDSSSDLFPPNPYITNDKLADKIQLDVGEANSAALTAILKGVEPGNGVDHDLLLQILSNTTMVEKLWPDYGNPNPVPTISSNLPQTFNQEIPRPPFMPLSSVQPPPPPPRDMDYYKNLIQQHGREAHHLHHHHSNGVRVGPNPEFESNGSNPKMRDFKRKMIRHCMYFNTARGCRNGANCTFLHDSSLPPRTGNSMAAVEAQQSSKRMKFDR